MGTQFLHQKRHPHPIVYSCYLIYNDPVLRPLCSGVLFAHAIVKGDYAMRQNRIAPTVVLLALLLSTLAFSATAALTHATLEWFVLARVFT